MLFKVSFFRRGDAPIFLCFLPDIIREMRASVCCRVSASFSAFFVVS